MSFRWLVPGLALANARSLAVMSKVILLVAPLAAAGCAWNMTTPGDAGEMPDAGGEVDASVETDAGASTAWSDDGGGYVHDVLTSGSRLRAQYISGAAGARSFMEFFDTVRAETCMPNEQFVAADGVVRCLPWEKIRMDDEGLFSDPAATQHAVRLTSGSPQQLPSLTDLNTCPLRIHVYEAGATLTVPDGGVAQFFVRHSDGGVEPVRFTLSPNDRIAAYGPEIPPSAFAAGTMEYTSRSAIFHGDDDSRWFAFFRSGDAGTSCLPGWPDATLRCVPIYMAAVADPFFSADAQCRSRAAWAYRSACADPPLASDWSSQDECSGATAGYLVITDAGILASGDQTSCTPIDFPAVSAWTVGPPAPADEFEPMQAVNGPRFGDRLEARIASFDGGPSMLINWYDTQLNAVCNFALAGDGKYRCLPFRTGIANRQLYSYLFGWSEVFADSACSVPAATTRNGCAPSFARLGPSLFPITAAASGGLWLKAGDDCRDASDAGYSVWRVGPELAPETFVEGRVVIE